MNFVKQEVLNNAYEYFDLILYKFTPLKYANKIFYVLF